MASQTHQLLFYRTEHSLLTLEDLAAAAGLRPEVVENLFECGLIEPSAMSASHPLFLPSAEERLRRIMRLRRDLGVNLAGVAVILHMREQIESLQRDLEQMRRRFGLGA